MCHAPLTLTPVRQQMLIEHQWTYFVELIAGRNVSQPKGWEFESRSSRLSFHLLAREVHAHARETHAHASEHSSSRGCPFTGEGCTSRVVVCAVARSW